MLKAKELVDRRNGLLRTRRSPALQNADEDQNQALMSAVIEANPQFKRLNGVLIGLADACMDSANSLTGGGIVGVCSSVKGEGKTTISLGLATALARRSAASVLLLEADLTTPTMTTELGLKGDAGLADCLTGSSTLEDAVQKSPVDHLSIIAAGQAKVAPLTLFEKPELTDLITTLRAQYTHIVVDMPPILEREDASRLVELVDKVIFLIGAGKVTQRVVEDGITAVGRDKLMGVILNGAWNEAPSWLSRVLMPEPTPAFDS